MTVSAIISGILAVLKAIPVIDGWFQSLYTAYFQMKSQEHDQAFVDATRSLIHDHDQRALEEAATDHPSRPANDQTDVTRRPSP